MIRRVLTAPVLVGAVAVLAGCVGNTDPATDVRATQAQLNAHGHTNNGPASWWWEYGTSRSSVANGQGTQTPHQGPASSGTSDVSLNSVVKGLDKSQAYYLRACGQDKAAGGPKTCGKVEGLYTAPADSTLRVADTANGIVRYTGATTVAHNIVVTDSLGPSTHDNIEDLEDPSTSPPTGSDVLPTGGSCLANPSVQFKASGLASYVDSAYCFGEANIQAALGPYSDVYDATRSDLAQQADLGAGNDYYVGAAVSDTSPATRAMTRSSGRGGTTPWTAGPTTTVSSPAPATAISSEAAGTTSSTAPRAARAPSNAAPASTCSWSPPRRRTPPTASASTSPSSPPPP